VVPISSGPDLRTPAGNDGYTGVFLVLPEPSFSLTTWWTVPVRRNKIG